MSDGGDGPRTPFGSAADLEAFSRAASGIIRAASRFVPDPSWPPILDLAREVWGEPNRQLSTKDDIRFGIKGSKSVKPSENVWKDHETGEAGGYLDLHKMARGVLPQRAARAVEPQWLSRDQDVKAAYNYTDAAGNLLLQVVRTHSGKPRFRLRRPDGNGGFHWNADGVVKPLYRLPELRAAPTDSQIWIAEGEKDADRLAKLGLVATTNIGGASSWSSEYLTELTGRHVILLEDNDLAGRKRCAKLAIELKSIVASLKVITFEDLPEHGDVSDWLDRGHGLEDLRKRARDARAPDDLVRTAVDGRKARKSGGGKPLELTAPEPWDTPVDGLALANDLHGYYAKFALLPEGGATALTLWGMHTHCFNLWKYSPRLHIHAAYKRSGKTRTLELLSYTSSKALQSDSITAAALFRTVSEHMPCLLLDEADETVAGNDELQAMLNSGFQRGGGVVRCAPNTLELEWFETFCPVAIAGIGRLKGTLEDRAIQLELHRALLSERRPKLNREAEAVGARLARQSARWVMDNLEALKAATPDVSHLDDRTDDKWFSLYCIAEVLGRPWPTKVREASSALTQRDTDVAGLVEQLLTDIEQVFTDAAADCRTTELESKDLVDRLRQLEGRPWCDDVPQERGPAKPLTTNKLARLLWSVRIEPRMIGPETRRRKGYRLTDFTDAFARNRPFEKQKGA
jgi:hypothetical protein